MPCRVVVSARSIDLWTRAKDASRPRIKVPITASGSSVRVLGFDIYVEHQAKESTRIGPLAWEVAEALGGGRLDRWGPREPLTDPWNAAAITELVQSQMPESQTVLAGSDDGGFTQVRVSRTRFGLLEHVTGGVVAPAGASTADLLEVASGALERVAESFRMAVGVVSVPEYDRATSGVGGARDDARVKTLVRRVRGYPPEVPLAVVLGARLVHELGLDMPGLRERFDVRPVGPGRLKAQLVRLSGESAPWAQFAEFARRAVPETTIEGVA